MKTIKLPPFSSSNIIELLHTADFPIQELSRNPISVIEGLATVINSKFIGVCGRKCIGCSANAFHPSDIKSSAISMKPLLLDAIIHFALKLAQSDIQFLSQVRLNMFGGSNELDHPHCLELRKIVSLYYRELIGHPLGFISSDLRFHISPTTLFKKNLSAILEEPTLFDNICISIDEQTPFKNCNEYGQYLDNLNWVWKTLFPALSLELNHANAKRNGSPRVIINLLLPPKGSFYADSYSVLYRNGPCRATCFKELVERYINPFLGRLDYCDISIPPHHLFTTAIGTLENVAGSRVFISEATFEPVGKARYNLKMHEQNFINQKWYYPTIRTKIYPVSETSFAIRANLAPNQYSDGEMPFNHQEEPIWVNKINDYIFDISEYLK